MSFPSSRSRRGEERDAAGIAAFNTLLSCILIAILISTGMVYYLRLIRQAREVALQSELVNIRTAIFLFTTLNRRFPGSLRELVEKKYLLPDAEFSLAEGKIKVENRSIFARAYLEAQSLDAQGRILDPFGNPYRYDPRCGRVSPPEEEYLHW